MICFRIKNTFTTKKECYVTKMMEILCVRLLTTIIYHQKQSYKIDGLPYPIFSAVCYGLQMQIEKPQWPLD